MDVIKRNWWLKKKVKIAWESGYLKWIDITLLKH